jgi:predicted nucleotidyltransferase
MTATAPHPSSRSRFQGSSRDPGAWYVQRVTAAEIEAALREELPRLVPGLAAAYLFGSVARGEARASSDVDVGLLYETPPASTLLGQPLLAAAELESKLKRRVDLVVLNGASPDLVHRVLRDGILLLQPNPSVRIAFEVRMRNQYFDLLPYLRRYRRTEPAA